MIKDSILQLTLPVPECDILELPGNITISSRSYVYRKELTSSYWACKMQASKPRTWFKIILLNLYRYFCTIISSLQSTRRYDYDFNVFISHLMSTWLAKNPCYISVNYVSILASKYVDTSHNFVTVSISDVYPFKFIYK